MTNKSKYCSMRHTLRHENKDGQFPNCIIDGCNHGHYSKGLCKNHYTKLIRTGSPTGLLNKCKFKDCSNTTKKIFCSKHLKIYIVRKNKGLNLYSSRKETFENKNNPKWNNGASQYKMPGEMKRNRLIKLQSEKFSCELCGQYTKYIHHKDFKKINHSLTNLQALCTKCHYSIHRSHRNIMKFKL
jgi:hypothetical protein